MTPDPRSSLEALAQRIRAANIPEFEISFNPLNCEDYPHYPVMRSEDVRLFLSLRADELEAALARVEQETAHETRSPDGDGHDTDLPHRVQAVGWDAYHIGHDNRGAGSEPAESHTTPAGTPQEARLNLEPIKALIDDYESVLGDGVVMGEAGNLITAARAQLKRLRSPGAGEARLPRLAWLLIEKWRDGSEHLEGIALDNDTASVWVHSNVGVGHSRTSLLYMVQAGLVPKE